MKDIFNPRGYPESYLEGFKQDDSLVVARFAERLRTQTELPDAIVVTMTDKGHEVWTRFTDTESHMDVAINWSEPEKRPRDYYAYARTFWGFEGPRLQQLIRANLLALELGIRVVKIPEEL